MSNSSTDFTPAHLPDGPWQVLLQYELALLDDAAKHGGVSDPVWTVHSALSQQQMITTKDCGRDNRRAMARTFDQQPVTGYQNHI